jgi:hypothetical protein
MLRVHDVEFLLLNLILLTFLALKAKASGLGSAFLGSIAWPSHINIQLVMDACHGKVF